MWIFGYGSLIWKVDFPYKRKQVGYIKGYKRRFYQHSVDHRGRPWAPGRVVTLLPALEDEKVWGVAYEIHPYDVEAVVQHLDYREKSGYEKNTVTFYPYDIEDGSTSMVASRTLSPFELTIYIGSEDNSWYAGPAEISDMAKQILQSEGPSGTNKEYLYNLADSMRMLTPGIEDEHLFTLEAAVKRLEEKRTTIGL